MVTVNRLGGSSVDKGAEIFGKSTDTKPTQNIPNGSVYIEMDTGDGYFFDADTNTWVKP